MAWGALRSRDPTRERAGARAECAAGTQPPTFDQGCNFMKSIGGGLMDGREKEVFEAKNSSFSRLENKSTAFASSHLGDCFNPNLS